MIPLSIPVAISLLNVVTFSNLHIFLHILPNASSASLPTTPLALLPFLRCLGPSTVLVSFLLHIISLPWPFPMYWLLEYEICLAPLPGCFIRSILLRTICPPFRTPSSCNYCGKRDLAILPLLSSPPLGDLNLSPLPSLEGTTLSKTEPLLRPVFPLPGLAARTLRPTLFLIRLLRIVLAAYVLGWQALAAAALRLFCWFLLQQLTIAALPAVLPLGHMVRKILLDHNCLVIFEIASEMHVCPHSVRTASFFCLAHSAFSVTASATSNFFYQIILFLLYYNSCLHFSSHSSTIFGGMSVKSSIWSHMLDNVLFHRPPFSLLAHTSLQHPVHLAQSCSHSASYHLRFRAFRACLFLLPLEFSLPTLHLHFRPLTNIPTKCGNSRPTRHACAPACDAGGMLVWHLRCFDLLRSIRRTELKVPHSLPPSIVVPLATNSSIRAWPTIHPFLLLCLP